MHSLSSRLRSISSTKHLWVLRCERLDEVAMSSDGEVSPAAADRRFEEFRTARSRPVAGRKVPEERASEPESSWLDSLGFLQLAFAMALLSVVLVGLLAIFDAPASQAAAGTPGREVTCGSVIKLQHERTKYRLHSHDVPYGSGSGQQSVTAFPGVEDANSYWMVEIVDQGEQGDVIPNGAIVRLQHVRTRKWLHSHLHQSPLSGNLEVSAFGGDEQTDSGDYWKLEIEGKDPVWTLDQKVRLRHVDTNAYLHSHNMKYNQLNQREVCGVTKKNADNVWSAAEGIYFRPKGSSLE